MNGSRFSVGRSDGQIVERVASLAIVCQFLWMMIVNNLLMWEKGVIMRRRFCSVGGVR